MVKRFVLWLVALFLILPVVFSQQVSLNFTVQPFVTNVLNVPITNVNNATTYNVSFVNTSRLFSNKIDSLAINETRNLTVQVVSNVIGSGVENTTLTFLIDDIVIRVPQAKNIEILNNGYSPQTVNLIAGSSVNWRNNDTVSHTVTSSLFDQTLAPNQTFTHAFNTPSSVVYFDKLAAFTGTVNVENQTITAPVNKPELHKSVAVTLETLPPRTNVRLTIVEPTNLNLTIENDQSREGVLKVENLGNETAVGIRLSATNFTSFGKDNFNVSAFDSSFVTFTIRPQLNTVQESNKSFTIIFRVNSTNAQSDDEVFSVFVPLVQTVNNTNTGEFFRDKLRFCQQFPTSPFCVSEPVIIERNVTVFVPESLPFNFSQQDIKRINDNLLTIDELFRQQQNLQKEQNVLIQQRLDEVAKIIPTVGLLQDDIDDTKTFVTGIVITVITVLVGGGLFLGIKYGLQVFAKFKNVGGVLKK